MSVNEKEYNLGIQFKGRKPMNGWNPDSREVLNGHLLVTGGSGSGKTTLVKDLIKHLGDSGKIVFVLDIHNGMEVEGENYIEYTARNTAFGINPMEFDNDLKNGGPEVRADMVVQSFKKFFMPNAGPVQLNVLRDLLLDTYRYKGIIDSDESTWHSYTISDDIIDNENNSILPTMSDLEDVYQMILNKVTLGEDSTDFSQLSQELVYYRKKIDNSNSKITKEKYQNLLKERQEIHEKMREQFNEYIEEGNIEGSFGWIDKYGIDYSKYTDKAVVATLKTLGVYIRKFSSTNIFNQRKPNFIAGINRLDISGFANADKPEFALFFFDLFLQRVFRKCKLKGEYKERTAHQRRRGAKCDIFIVIDESRVVLPVGKEKDNPYHILNRIVSEARKYGLGIVLATQRISHYNEEILANIYTKIILKTDASDVDSTNKKLNIVDKELIKLTNHPGVGIIGMGGIYKAVHMNVFQQFSNNPVVAAG